MGMGTEDVQRRFVRRRRRRGWASRLLVVTLAVVLSGCAAGRAFRQGEAATRVGDWDSAVAFYTRALQENPDRIDYRIALERAMLDASRAHLARAQEFEAREELSAAMLEYREASELDPTNQQAAAKVANLERLIRDRIEAERPRPAIERMREQARQAMAPPLLNPASRELLQMQFVDANLQDIVDFIGDSTGINVTYDQQFQDRQYTVRLAGVTIEEALNQILSANQSFYKVINERTIIVIPDTPQKRAQYEEQVIRTFYVSHADVNELSQLISTIIRVPQMAVQPMVAVNATNNSITIRATTAVAGVIERIVSANDKPLAEVVVDVEILEVNRERVKQFGLNLTQYALGGIFSPEVPPPNTATAPDGVSSPPPFNLNTVSRGVSTGDFFGAVPAAFVRFLESDARTRFIARPQLRGQEGQQLTLNLGEEIPVPTTAFSPIATGGAAVNPLTSFNYRPVGVILEMTPRVTFEDEIILDLMVENSTLGANIEVAGTSLPTFGSRRVVTRLRLRDGETNLLAGLLREQERRALRGFPGLLRIPIIRDLFSNTDEQISQTDIVMLLTPHIVRTHGLTQEDLNPIHIGTQQNIGLSGPPPLIAAPPLEPATAGPGPAAELPTVPLGTQPMPTPPPGTAPRPGMPTPVVPVAPADAPAPAAQPPPAAGPPPEAAPLPPVADSPIEGLPDRPRVLVTPPGTEFRIGGGPYTVPISVTGVSQLTTVSLSMNYDPNTLRVRSVQEGSFMRQGGLGVTFTQSVDPVVGRVDLTLARTSDPSGAAGSGLLAAVLFEAQAAGVSPLTVSGVGTSPTGEIVSLAFSPVTVSVR